MGAWGENIYQSDTSYDYLDTVERAFDKGYSLYDLINEEYNEAQKQLLAEEIKRLRKDMLALVKDSGDDYGVYGMAFAGILRLLDIPLNEEEKKVFKIAYELEADEEELECWSDPDLRKKYLDYLKKSVEENIPYKTSHKGLLEVMGA